MSGTTSCDAAWVVPDAEWMVGEVCEGSPSARQHLHDGEERLCKLRQKATRMAEDIPPTAPADFAVELAQLRSSVRELQRERGTNCVHNSLPMHVPKSENGSNLEICLPALWSWLH